MKRIAVIGTGIAGMGCGHFLNQHHDLTFFEQERRPGGHTNTVDVAEKDRSIPIDTGFMVYNEVTYPNLTRLFSELGLQAQETDMSFSVQHRPTGLEYNGSSINHLFAQRRNLFRPRHWKLLMQINRFNKEAIAALEKAETRELSLTEYVERGAYGDDFFNLFLIPMSSAVWSTPPEKMLQFPAATLLRFFHNHGFLGLDTQHQWLTVKGGSKSYLKKIISPFKKRIRLGNGATSVHRKDGKAIVETTNGEKETFDQVIFACHADQALRILKNANEKERRLLSPFKYERNLATLHTDESVMPKAERAWASWNYRIDQGEPNKPKTSTIYWMNSLQNVSDRQNYFVSINGSSQIQTSKVLKRIEYDHPLFDLAAIQAQDELPTLNTQSANQQVFFCGSYFKYGFHEDAFTSALNLCRVILGKEIWS